MNELIDMSPNKVATASYVLEHIMKDGFLKTYLTLRDGCLVAKTSGRGYRLTTKAEPESQNNSVGCSSKFSTRVKCSGICQVTGARSGDLVATHILSFSARQGDNPKIQQY